jgi:hypothetical protein
MSEDKKPHDDNRCKKDPCFKCKIRSIAFGTVPGGYKSSTS